MNDPEHNDEDLTPRQQLVKTVRSLPTDEELDEAINAYRRSVLESQGEALDITVEIMRAMGAPGDLLRIYGDIADVLKSLPDILDGTKDVTEILRPPTPAASEE